MNRDERNRMYHRIFLFYIPNSQKVQAIQEFSELIQALTKDINNQGSRENLIEEIADSKIMLEQMQLIFDITDDDLKKVIYNKFERRIEKYLRTMSACGPTPLIIQAIQELSEFILVLIKDINNRSSRLELIEEMTDSEIMLDQMQSIFNITDEDLEKVMDKKIERQLTRIRNAISNLENLRIKNNYKFKNYTLDLNYLSLKNN